MPKKKGKGLRAFVCGLAIFGGLTVLGLGTAGVTYLVKPYQVDINWVQEQVETPNDEADTSTNTGTENDANTTTDTE